MLFVVTKPCIQCKYTDCVSVCPMDCLLEGPNFLAIDPTECIDCRNDLENFLIPASERLLTRLRISASCPSLPSRSNA